MKRFLPVLALLTFTAHAKATVYHLAVVPESPPSITVACRAENMDLAGVINKYRAVKWKTVDDHHAFGVFGWDIERELFETDPAVCRDVLARMIQAGAVLAPTVAR